MTRLGRQPDLTRAAVTRRGMSAGCRPGSVAEPEACGRTTRRRRVAVRRARRTACTGLTRARVSQLSSTSRRSPRCGPASAPTPSLRCCCSRCAGSSGSGLASDGTPSRRPCLAHAGVFSAWFAPLFEQPALDRSGRAMTTARSIRAGQHRRSRHRWGELRRGLGVTRPLGRALLQLLPGAPARPGRPRPGGQPLLFEPAKPRAGGGRWWRRRLGRSRAGGCGPGRGTRRHDEVQRRAAGVPR
jgi:hypothetical protein